MPQEDIIIWLRKLETIEDRPDDADWIERSLEAANEIEGLRDKIVELQGELSALRATL